MSNLSLFASLPNLISLGRLVLVPVVIVFIIQPQNSAAPAPLPHWVLRWPRWRLG